MNTNGLKLAAVFLVLSLVPLPIGFYSLSRWVIFLSIGFHIYTSEEKPASYIWLIIVGILFNPVFPLWLSREVWLVVDLVAIVIVSSFLMGGNISADSQSLARQLQGTSRAKEASPQKVKVGDIVDSVEGAADRHARKMEPYLIVLIIILIVITVIKA
ncbi:hypothetical protein OAC12_06375 [Porticoccaceae bacterium]|nr:hypothetical protein [Porticoccaceae bacterium]